MSTAPVHQNWKNMAHVGPPYVQNLDLWISREDVLRLTGKTRQWLYLQEKDGVIQSRNTTRRLGNGSFEKEYAASTLPAGAREKLAAEQQKLQPTRAMALPFRTPAPTVEIAPRRVALVSEEAITEADERMQVLSPILEYRKFNGKLTLQLFLCDGKPVDSLSRMVRYQAENATYKGKLVPEPTIWRWLRRYDANGKTDLARRPRKDSGVSDFFAKNPRAAWWIAALYMGDKHTPGLSFRHCYETLVVDHAHIGITKEEIPSYHTVRRFLRTAGKALADYARNGRKYFQDKHAPYLRRSHNEFSNQIWVSDHMICDVEVMNDCFDGEQYGKPVRLRLTCIFDDHSRYVVGYNFAWEGDNRSIANAMRMAILQYGPPETFYCDNGKDFKKVAKGAMPTYLKHTEQEPKGWWDSETRHIEELGIMGRLGISVTHCIPHHPQSKHIERFFGTVHKQFCSLWWTYTGGTPSRRPDQTTAAMMLQRKALKHGRPQDFTHPPASVFIAMFRTWLDGYHARIHQGEGMAQRSPLEVFDQDRNPHQRPIPSEEELLPLLSEQTTCRVNRCRIKLNKSWYVVRVGDAEANLQMMRLNGEDTVVAYDPLATDTIAVLDNAGHYICTLEREQTVSFAPGDPETQATIAGRRRLALGAEKAVREKQQEITLVARRMGMRTPLERLAEKTAMQSNTSTDHLITQRKPKLADLAPETKPTLHAFDIAQQFLSSEEE